MTNVFPSHNPRIVRVVSLCIGVNGADEKVSMLSGSQELILTDPRIGLEGIRLTPFSLSTEKSSSSGLRLWYYVFGIFRFHILCLITRIHSLSSIVLLRSMDIKNCMPLCNPRIAQSKRISRVVVIIDTKMVSVRGMDFRARIHAGIRLRKIQLVEKVIHGAAIIRSHKPDTDHIPLPTIAIHVSTGCLHRQALLSREIAALGIQILSIVIILCRWSLGEYGITIQSSRRIGRQGAVEVS